jgi:hypothetical protein
MCPDFLPVAQDTIANVQTLTRRNTVELLITLLIFALIVWVLLAYVVPLLGQFAWLGRVIVIVCAAFWLITHLRELIHGVMSLFP